MNRSRASGKLCPAASLRRVSASIASGAALVLPAVPVASTLLHRRRSASASAADSVPLPLT